MSLPEPVATHKTRWRLGTVVALLGLLLLSCVLLFVRLSIERDPDPGTTSRRGVTFGSSSTASSQAPAAVRIRDHALDRERDARSEGTNDHPRTGSLRVIASTAHDATLLQEIAFYVRPPFEDYWIRGRPNAAGVCEFHDLPAGRGSVTCDRGGSWTAEITAGETHDLVVAIGRGYEVTGTVLDSEGKPVSNAWIWTSQWMDFATGFHVATTESDGSFRISAVAAESTNLAARASLYAPSAFVRVSSECPSVTLVLPGLGGDLEGTVKTDRGLPIAGARLWLGQRGFYIGDAGNHSLRWGACTDSSGQYTIFGVAEGSFPLVVTANQYAPHLEEAHIESGMASRLDLALSQGGSVVGRVTDSRSEPVPDVRLSVHEHQLAKHVKPAVTDATGAYALVGLPQGAMLVVARGSSGDTDKKNVIISSAETIQWDPKLEGSQRLKVMLTDERGETLDGWTVKASGGSRELPLITNEAGEVEMKWPDRSQEFTLSFYHPTCPTFSCRRASFLSLETPLRCMVADFEMPTAYITGVVEEADVCVLWLQNQNRLIELLSRTLQNGVPFRIGPLPPGDYSVTVHADGYKSYVSSRVLQVGDECSLGAIRMVREE